MAYWLIELKGSEKAFAFLREFLKSKDLSVETDQRGTYIRLSELGDETDPASLIAPARRIIDVVNGAAWLLWPHFELVKSNTIHKVADDGSRHSFGYLTAPPPYRTFYAFSPDDPTLINWINLADKQPIVEKALALYSLLPHDWRGLYMILEVVKDDIGSWDALATRGFVTRTKLRNFKHTADSFAAVGHSARHATTSITAPAKPMKLEDAKLLVDEILQKWLASKSQTAHRPSA